MKKFVLFFLLAAFLHSCYLITLSPRYSTMHGMLVYFKDDGLIFPRKTSIELVTNYVVDYLQADKAKLRGYRIVFTGRWIKVPRSNNKFDLADGLTNTKDKIVVVSVFQDCLADSSLPHEISHVLYETDFHNNDKYSKKIQEMERQIIKDLCPPGYIHKNIPADPEYEAK